MKIIIFGISKNGEHHFINANKSHNFNLTFVKENLTQKNVHLCKNHDAIVVTALDDLGESNLKIISNTYKIKYIVSRSTGIDNINLNLFKKYNIKSANGSGYSPSAIAEFAISLSLYFSTHLNASFEIKNEKYNTRKLHMRKEIKSSVIGIVGLGKIGTTVAKLFKGLGANKIIGYGKYKSDDAKKLVDFLEWNDFLKQADIVIVTTSYRPKVNDNMFNKKAFDQMKDGSIFINVARGELHDDQALYNALISNKLLGAGTDVLRNEKAFLFNDKPSPSKFQKKLINLYPKFIYTPHIAYFSTDALNDMAKISLENIYNLVNKKEFWRRIS